MRLPLGAIRIGRWRLSAGPVLALILLPAVLCGSDPLTRFLNPASLSALRSGGTVVSRLAVGGVPRLLPSFGGDEGVAPIHPTIGVEMLRILVGNGEPFETPQGMLRLFNSLHAVSTLKGIPYYSVTRSNTQVLFSQSFAVADPRGNTRIPDPVFDSLPRTDVLYTFQEDQNFGRNTYREVFSAVEDHLSVRIENVTNIMLLFVPIIRPHDLVSYVALMPAGNELAFYGLAYLTTGFPIGDRHSREESLLNRLKAMETWLAGRVGATP